MAVAVSYLSPPFRSKSHHAKLVRPSHFRSLNIYNLRAEFISGFTGSAGCAIVSMTKAALSTDGRYFNQAAKQLDSNWLLLKRGFENMPTWQEWTAEQAEGGKVVGVDPSLITASDARSLSETIKKSGGSLQGVQENLVDLVWGKDRPSRPCEKVAIHPIEFAGKSFEDKVNGLRKELQKKKSAGFIIFHTVYIDLLFLHQLPQAS
ncbi:hypothetical protein ACJ72_05290 [Emergomyces africanus]|uniref:Creatinase N-terminal domain-containing protein n=1 Tax=Emergomyces africanus TaxID=1955775 RepID=A0A1B7NUC7_9EURO|nr:hypothetical protein ACJ72_05290 [Emergomyces africanus]